MTETSTARATKERDRYVEEMDGERFAWRHFSSRDFIISQEVTKLLWFFPRHKPSTNEWFLERLELRHSP